MPVYQFQHPGILFSRPQIYYFWIVALLFSLYFRSKIFDTFLPQVAQLQLQGNLIVPLVFVYRKNGIYLFMIGDQFPFSAETKPNGIDKLRIIPLAQGASQVNNPQFINAIGFRSEEHTSELQSRFDLVCRLLLEKKKHNKTPGRKMSEIELH